MNRKKNIFITVKNQFDGLHCYPNAPEEVSYLRNVHRHTFMIESTIQVFHEDREIEFYMAHDYIDEQIKLLEELEISKSCENIANFILDKLAEKYITDKSRQITVSVSEDGRNQATVGFAE